MNKISCDICKDLIPLVKDNVASEDSYNLVKKHIDECNKCKVLFDENIEVNQNMNDEKVISKIKNQLMLIALILVVLGSVIGVGLSESEGMFYNILIMPVIGALAYFALRKKYYIVLLSMFAFTYLYHFIKYMIDGIFDKSQLLSSLMAPLLWTILYSGLCAIGMLITFLLYIAFKKENK